jgi:hypothetical protein
MKILIIHKEPIIDRIPNLKSFILFSGLKGHQITILTTSSNKFPQARFPYENIKYKTVKERTAKLQLPTSLRFYLKCVLILCANIFNNYKLIIAGKNALAFSSFLKFKRYFGFIIEYPELNFEKMEEISLYDKLEIKGIRNSMAIITHDNLHADYIFKKLKINNLPYFTIPNGTVGKAKKTQSAFLQNRLDMSIDQKILLHSGGFGPWFDSIVLANYSSLLPDEIKLVFHVSHDITQDVYYKSYLEKEPIREKVSFSLIPVESKKLDELISSAYVGIAWYSKTILGFRAEMLGLSAGKIGNYLKCGIPVVVPDFNSLGYVSKYACGKQISGLEELSSAIADIEKNYSTYSINAINCYNDLWDTERYCDLILSQIE